IYIFIYLLSTAGIPVAISKLISEQEAVGNHRGSKKILKVSAVFIITISCFLAIFLALTSTYITKMLKQPDAYLMLIVLSPALLFTAISSVLRGYFQGKLNMIPTAISQVLEQLLNSILTVVFVALFIKYGVDKAAAGSSLATTISAIGAASFLLYIFLREKREEKNNVENQSDNQLRYIHIIKRILTYVFPAILGLVALNTNELIDLALVPRMIEGGISQVKATELYGVFTTQYQRILNLPLIIGASLSMVITPAISSAEAVKDFGLLKRKVVEGFKVSGITMIPAAIGLAVLSKPIIVFVFFNTAGKGSDLMTRGSWLVIFMTFVYVQSGVLNGINKPHIPPINLLIGMGIKVVIVYFLTVFPSINVKSAIIGSIVGFSFAFIRNHYYIKKYTNISVNYLSLLYKPVISSIIMGIVAYLSYNGLYMLFDDIISQKIVLNDICLIISIIVSALVYVFILSKIKGIDSNDVLKLPLGRKLNTYMKKFKFI
ncbi:MAG: polysaccharide biosynthesis protein, partial [Clostridiales bacterium]